MKNRILYFCISAWLVSCNNPTLPVTINNDSKTIVTVVVDYSKSYNSLVALDSAYVTSLMVATAKTGGTVVHVPIVDNSSSQSVYLTRIEKFDTTHMPDQEKNVYKAARIREQNKKRINSFTSSLQVQVSDFLTEIRKYEQSQHTDLQPSLGLAQHTICEPLYTKGDHPYKRYVLILSDVLNDPPGRSNKHLTPLDYCGSTVLLVRPSPSLSQDSLQHIFKNAELHIFTTIIDAVSFINEQ